MLIGDRPGFGLSSSSNNFGSSQVGAVGLNSNSSIPGSIGGSCTFATCSVPSVFAGSSAGAFGVIGASSTLGSSTTSTSAAPISACGSPSLLSSSSLQSSSSSKFGFQPQDGGFGQSSNSNSNSFAPGLVGSATPIATLSQPPAFAGSCTCGFAAFSSPLSSQSTFGASPTFGGSASSTSAASISAFERPSLLVSAFGWPSSSKDFQSQIGAFRQASNSSSTSFGLGLADGTNSFATSSGPLVFGCQAPSSMQSVFGASSTLGSSVFGKVPAPTSGKIVSISAMPTYEHKSHEELKFEQYQLKGGQGSSVINKNPGSFFQQTLSTSANHIYGSFTALGPSSQSTFVNYDALVSGSVNSVSHSCKCTESLGCSLTPSFCFTGPAFGSHTAVSVSSSAIGPRNVTPTVSKKEFGPSAIKCQYQGNRVASYAATPEVFGKVTTPTSGKIVSISAMPTYEHKSHEELKFEDYQLKGGQGTTSGFSSGMNNNIAVSSTKLQFLEPSVEMTNASSESTLAQSQPDISKAQSTGPVLQPGIAPHSQKTQTAFASNATPICISNQSSGDPNAGIGIQKLYKQQSESQSNLTIERSPITNPFGAEPTVQISVDCPVSTTTIQYGISCLDVKDNPSPVRRRSLMTVRHLSLGRNRPTVSKYKPESNHKKVPFYEEGLSDVYTFKAPFIPRGNPRAWLLRPIEEQSTKAKLSRSFVLEEKSKGISNEASKERDGASSPAKLNQSLNGTLDDSGNQEGKVHIILQGHQVDEDATTYVDAADVQTIMPKLQCPEYYTVPPINELAAKERAEPGFCRHVKDFVVGRHGYGSIKFLGETDVTNLDLDSLVQFNYREVIIYMDESKKPPVGQGLNKPAEITLLNVKCINKNTEWPHVEGPMVDRYRQMLIKKGAEQGAEFVSYDPASGEWKFRVLYF